VRLTLGGDGAPRDGARRTILGVDPDPDGLFGLHIAVIRSRGWVGRPRPRGRFVDGRLFGWGGAVKRLLG
jgi:hypothetical protein